MLEYVVTLWSKHRVDVTIHFTFEHNNNAILIFETVIPLQNSLEIVAGQRYKESIRN